MSSGRVEEIQYPVASSGAIIVRFKGERGCWTKCIHAKGRGGREGEVEGRKKEVRSDFEEIGQI